MPRFLYQWWSSGVPHPTVNMKIKTPSSWQMPHGKWHHRKELSRRKSLDSTGSLDSQRPDMVYTFLPGTCAYFWGCRLTWQASASWSLYRFSWSKPCEWGVINGPPASSAGRRSSASVSQVCCRQLVHAGRWKVKGERCAGIERQHRE